MAEDERRLGNDGRRKDRRIGASQAYSGPDRRQRERRTAADRRARRA